MNFCPGCGAKLEGAPRFCSGCGRPTTTEIAEGTVLGKVARLVGGLFALAAWVCLGAAFLYCRYPGASLYWVMALLASAAAVVVSEVARGRAGRSSRWAYLVPFLASAAGTVVLLAVLPDRAAERQRLGRQWGDLYSTVYWRVHQRPQPAALRPGPPPVVVPAPSAPRPTAQTPARNPESDERIDVHFVLNGISGDVFFPCASHLYGALKTTFASVTVANVGRVPLRALRVEIELEDFSRPPAARSTWTSAARGWSA